MDITAVAAGAGYASPMVGPVDHTAHIKLDTSALTTGEVDADGYLKPGLPLLQTGLPVTAGAVFGVVHEAIKLPLTVIPPTDVSLAAETKDPLIAVATHGIMNRDIAEDNLGRALSGAEVTGFATAPCTIKLTTT
jgi:hypothetical protein